MTAEFRHSPYGTLLPLPQLSQQRGGSSDELYKIKKLHFFCTSKCQCVQCYSLNPMLLYTHYCNSLRNEDTETLSSCAALPAVTELENSGGSFEPRLWGFPVYPRWMCFRHLTQADTRAEVSLFEEIHTFRPCGNVRRKPWGADRSFWQLNRRGQVAHARVGGKGKSDHSASLFKPSHGYLSWHSRPIKTCTLNASSALPLAMP